ncbi:MAG: ATP-binding cassette domain-containing protein [Candidatus Promineifilaceae bacterium]
MVGRRVLLRVDKGPANPGEAAARGRKPRGHATICGVPRVKDVSFTVRAGEIVGIAGVAGNGQSELLESISGMRDQASGTVRLKGAPLSLEGDDGAHRARHAGLAHVPEDRQRMGLVAAFEEWENAILGYQDEPAYGKGLVLDIEGRAAPERASASQNSTSARPTSGCKTANFSGGNQQKIVLAREMESRSRRADRRPADARRRYRRHRVHPQPDHQDARRGQGHPAGLGRARRDPVALPTASS